MSKTKKPTITPIPTSTRGRSMLPSIETDDIGKTIYWCLFEAMKGSCTCEVCKKLRTLGDQIQSQWTK